MQRAGKETEQWVILVGRKITHLEIPSSHRLRQISLTSALFVYLESPWWPPCSANNTNRHSLGMPLFLANWLVQTINLGENAVKN